MSQNPWQDRQPPPEDRPPAGRPPPGSEEPTRTDRPVPPADGGAGYPPPSQGWPPPPGTAPQPGSWQPPPGSPQQQGAWQQPRQPYYAPPPRPANHLVWAIISILLFWPLGIPAVVFASQVNTKYALGDYAGAEDSSGKAKLFSLISTVIAVIGIVLLIVFAILTASMVDDYAPDNRY
ncbi:CD225/dispanin family protein [Streptomyces cinnamoneus]|uniref:CD225/dispanin family protein n=1 Tax=Streptomyces cinnamoneus TaxID=53446 RepID=UPI0034453486